MDTNSNAKNFQPRNINFIIDYPVEAQAGAVLQDSQDRLETQFERIQRAQQHAGDVAWAPFSSLADWELSRWLVQSGVSQREINKFLKLDSVRTDVHHSDCVMLNLHQDSIRCPPIYPKQACIF